MRNRGIPLQLSQDGVVADWHAEPFHQPLARTAASTVPEQTDNLTDPCGPARIWSSNRRQSIGERPSCAFPICTSPTAQQELHYHRFPLDGQILEAAAGQAMPTSTSPTTIGANTDHRSDSGNNPTVINGGRDTQYLDPGAGRPFRFPVHARP
jgi:hypothetical protein